MISRQTASALVPIYKGQKDVISTLGHGTNPKLVKTILANFPAAVAQTKTLAMRFNRGSIRESAQGVWDFLKNQIRYKEDPGLYQYVKLPNALIATGEGDCKSYALFAAAIMQNLGYPVAFRFVGYGGASQPGHVYTLAGRSADQVIIDGVWRAFDREKTPYTYKKDYNMEIATISGTGCTCQNGGACAGCIGKIPLPKKIITKVKEVAKKGKEALKAAAKEGPKSVIKTIGLAAPRTAFLQLVKLNVHGFATSLAKNREASAARWKKLGGNTGDLTHAINLGLKRKPILGIWDQYNSGAINGTDSIGVVAEGTAALLAAAAPIIAAMAGLLAVIKNQNPPPGPGATPGEGSESGPDSGTDSTSNTDWNRVDNWLDTAKNTLQTFTQNRSSSSGANQAAPDNSASDGQPDAPGSNLKPLLYIGGGLLLAKAFKII